MGNIFTIFRKEMIDMLRDRRTVLTMIVMPILLMPLILTVITTVSKNRMEKAQAKIINIAVISDNPIEDLAKINEDSLKNNYEKILIRRIQLKKDMKIIEGVSKDDVKQLIIDDSIDVALEIPAEFDQQIDNENTSNVNILYDITNDESFLDRAKGIVKYLNDKIKADRLVEVGKEDAWIHPVTSVSENIYTDTQSIGKMAGGFLPYLFVIFCLMGAMYPAIDLFTGEKERGTIETILTVPASRLQILLGKMLVVIISGVVSGLLTIFGLYLALKFNTADSADMKAIVSVAYQILSPYTIGLITLMLIPLTAFFSGILIPASIYAKSFKEAQSMIQPLTIFVILPLIIAMLPGFELNAMTALIPVVNVALATKEIVAGTIDYGLLSLVFVSLLVFAGIGIGLCVKWFGSEGNILRT